MLGDWKWYAALAVFALFSALVVLLPGPRAKSAGAIRAAGPTVNSTDVAPVNLGPTPDELKGMLHYTVQVDDTVASIARLFVIPEEDLRWANRIPDGGEMVAGDTIRVPAP